MTDGFTPEDIAKGIETMADMTDEEKNEMAVNARLTAEVYDFKKLTSELIRIIEGS